MKRPFGKNDVALLSERVNQTLTAIIMVNERVSKSFSDLIQSGKKRIHEERELKLRGIPTGALLPSGNEELLAALQDAGIDSVYQVIIAEFECLTSINGVNDLTAETLKHNAKQVAEEGTKEVVIPIDTQHATPSCSELITALVNYRYALKAGEISQRIFGLLPENPRKELHKLDPLTSELSWRLTNRQDKQSSIEAFRNLKAIMESVERIGSPEVLSQLSYFDTNDSWNEFLKKPDEYFDYLDNLFPGAFSRAQLIDVSDVTQLAEQFNQLIEKIDATENSESYYYETISEEGRRVLQEELELVSYENNLAVVRCPVIPGFCVSVLSDLIVALANYRCLRNDKEVIASILKILPFEPSKVIQNLEPLRDRDTWNRFDRINQLTAVKTYQQLKTFMAKDEIRDFVKPYTPNPRVSESGAWADFYTDLEEYATILEDYFPGQYFFVKNKVTDVNRIAKKWNEINKTLEILRNSVSHSYAEISEKVQNALEEEHITRLEMIPVENLKDAHSSISISKLRKEGFTNVYSVLCAENNKKSNHYSIRVDVFFASLRAKEISEEIWKSLQLRINLDNKTPAYTQLVASIAKYRIAIQIEKTVQIMLNALPDDSDQLSKRLLPLKKLDYWKKTDRIGQISAIKAYEQIQFIISMVQRIGEPTELLERLNIEEDRAWDDFSHCSVEYFTILEEVCPERFSQSEDGYGLGRELSQNVAATKVQLEGLHCSLRGYQEWGVKYILHQENVLLGDEMGLGKTVQSLAAMISLWNSGSKRFLVICPASVIENWCREISEKSILKAYNLHDNYFGNVERWKNDGGVAVINYEKLNKIIMHHNSVKIDMVVVDEAHYIKNPDAARRLNTLKICNNASRRLFMTGTPIENNVNEMVGLIDCLNHKVAQEAKRYSFDYSSEEFKRRVSPVYYRRKRDEVLGELPELIETKEWCHMTTEDLVAYEDTFESGALMLARRVSWNHQRYDKSSKIKRLKELVKEAQEEKRRILIFSFFLDTLDTIKRIYGDTCIGVINGSTSLSKRQEILDEFDKSPAGTVLAAQIEAGGVGLNIQAASVVIICEPQWKPSTETQAISRSYRMGQTRSVLVYRLLCLDSIDEHITKLLEKKQREFDTFADESVAAQRDLELEKVEINSRERKQLLASERERVLARKAAKDKMVVNEINEVEE